MRGAEPITLSSRLFLFALVALLPVFAVVWMLERELQTARQEEVRGLAARQTQQAGSEIARLIEGQRSLLMAIASAPSVMAFDRDRCSRYLASLAKRLPQLNAILVLDRSGDPRCAGDEKRRSANYADRPYFRTALERGDFVVGGYTVGRAEPPVEVLPMAAPIRDDAGTIVGVAVAGLRLSHLQAIIGAWPLPANGSLTIADSEGTIVARNPLPDRFVGSKIPPDFVERWVRGPAPGVEEVLSQDGTWRIVGYQPATAASDGIYVSSGYPRDAALAAAGGNWMWNVAVLGSGLLGAVATSVIAARTLIRRPVDDLVSLARSWSSGDPPRVPRPIPTREFETVAQSLDAMGHGIEERANAAARQQELLVFELHHRVKNLLAMVQAIGLQTAASVKAPAEFGTRFTDRIQALSRTTEMLTVRHWEGLNLGDLLKAEVDATAGSERVGLSGPDLTLPPQLALSVTLIAHELATNAVKYGCLAQPDGRLEVVWSTAEAGGRRTLDFEWRERCPSPVAPGTATGFGSKLIRRIVASIGSGGSRFEDGGLLFTMRADLDQEPTEAALRRGRPFSG